MKILCVPDIHGRDFWKEPCQQWQGLIVFLGDYHDPYPMQVSIKKSLENLEELVDFVKNNRNRCICLLGNHDAGYMENSRGNFICRRDVRNYYKVQDLLTKLKPQLIYHTDDHVIFSHSGILPAWLEDHAISHWYDLDFMDIDNEAFDDISPYRGGTSFKKNFVGSCIFGDLREYDEQPHISDYFQVFGHTQLIDKPIIKEDYACLDCRKCFVIDTETKKIEEYEKFIFSKS